ncbi:hypothetical protein [Neopusillimonas maritima]|uniref:DUF403 domain-containing protein n=1 Tax=Neopusillimonas maritima TaxID=2026239 RepID=A0ABX9MZU8_9BURK|nr:hypothetical protein [Neopusillimonas maritima]RII84367.1 hypothetical protein CJO09_03915 [Neopusillimonas maritima]
MKHPSKKQFLYAIKAFSDPLPVEEWLNRPGVPKAILGSDEQLARRYFLELVGRYRKLLDQAYSMECVKWLGAQTAFLNAKNAALGRENRFIDDERIVQLLQEAVEARRGITRASHILFGSEASISITWRLQDVFDKQASSREMKWLILVLGALYEYFHVPKAVPHYLSTRKRIRTLVATIEKGLEAQDKLFSTPIHGEGLWFQKAVQSAEPSSAVVLAKMDVQVALKRICQGTLPIFRDDDKSNERLLIYRLWLANKLVFGKPNRHVVQMLMQLEGVASVSEAAIRKTVSGFKNELVERNYHYYSNLVAHTRSSIIGR